MAALFPPSSANDNRANKYAQLLIENEVDMDALRLMTETHMKEMGIPMGPMLRILDWVKLAYGSGGSGSSPVLSAAAPPPTIAVPPPVATAPPPAPAPQPLKSNAPPKLPQTGGNSRDAKARAMAKAAAAARAAAAAANDNEDEDES